MTGKQGSEADKQGPEVKRARAQIPGTYSFNPALLKPPINIFPSTETPLNDPFVKGLATFHIHSAKS